MLYDPNWQPAETEIKLEEWQKVLLDAANLIEERGWTQGSLKDSKGYCMLGAIQQTIYGNTYSSGMHSDWYGKKESLKRKLYDKVISRLCETTGSFMVWTWNDRHGQTKDEVIKALQQAAKM